MTLLNLDNSFPVEDSNHAINPQATIRFINSVDTNTLGVMQRLQGDLVNRFIINEAKINEVVRAIVGHPVFSGWDDSPYSKVDGSRNFENPVGGVNPTIPAHFTTKEYVDSSLEVISENVQTLDTRIDNISQTIIHTSPWTEYVWNASAKIRLELPVSPSIPDLNDITSITLLEKLDVAAPTVAIPSPPPVWIYREIPISGTSGIKIDDMWVNGSGVVNIVLPNTAFYTSGYDSTYEATRPVRQRFFRAVVTALQ